MAKYDPLEVHLREVDQAHLDMKFETIESIIGDALPASARIYREWWSNEVIGTHVQAHAWVRAGWSVKSVNLESGRVAFTRDL